MQDMVVSPKIQNNILKIPISMSRITQISHEF